MDEEIVREFKNKNEKYISIFIDSYGGLINSIARKVLGNLGSEADVEECISDVVLLVWNNINSFKGDKSSFKTWVCAIAKYKAIDSRRKVMKNINIEPIEDFNLASKNNLEDEIVLKERKKELLDKVKLLNTEEQDIFVRRYLMNEPILEIANSYNVNRNYIDKKLYKIRNFLRCKFEERSEIVNGR